MTRIAYYTFPSGAVQGGIKMHIRHVETLRDLGFDAVLRTGANNNPPTWMTYKIPIRVGETLSQSDIAVVPEDAPILIERLAPTAHRVVVFCQNVFIQARDSLDAIAKLRQPVAFLAVAQGQARTLRRIHPGAHIDVVRAFADDRAFRPSGPRGPDIAFMPKKRPMEAGVIRGLLRSLHPMETPRPWRKLDGLSEAEVAASMAASELYLSLARFESLGMTALEAMASGCVCAGFLGVGGRDYGTAGNGFWAPDDDCEAAADALGQAADLVRTGGAPLKAVIEAGRETAAEWSYARFRRDLEETWMRLAPEARVRSGPLDT
ncbi:MAG: hypothetical protein EPO51_07945 [Phenylobacterium sp.]|uniref:hypothetical protein n=1 Tax=Phenylobacterium sp. TaxID=1871053 RepID=UPI001226EA06|nr:hypothetical protein [Phenylobacterium sp.]TAJ72695.1 MAG: hypothetical protein EPO51_07945 [Phenylobacterium sp.]